MLRTFAWAPPGGRRTLNAHFYLVLHFNLVCFAKRFFQTTVATQDLFVVPFILSLATPAQTLTDLNFQVHFSFC